MMNKHKRSCKGQAKRQSLVRVSDLELALRDFENDNRIFFEVFNDLQKKGGKSQRTTKLIWMLMSEVRGRVKIEDEQLVKMFCAGLALGWLTCRRQEGHTATAGKTTSTQNSRRMLAAMKRLSEKTSFAEMMGFLHRTSDWSAECVDENDPRAKQESDAFIPMTDEEIESWVDPSEVGVPQKVLKRGTSKKKRSSMQGVSEHGKILSGIKEPTSILDFADPIFLDENGNPIKDVDWRKELADEPETDDDEDLPCPEDVKDMIGLDPDEEDWDNRKSKTRRKSR
jgi:hypothetical protein